MGDNALGLPSSSVLSASTTFAEAGRRPVQRQHVAVIERAPEGLIDIGEARAEIDLPETRADQRTGAELELALAAVLGGGAVEVGLHFLQAHGLQRKPRLQALQT